MKKRLLALLLVLVMGLSLAACSAPAVENSNSPSPSESPAIKANLKQDILTFAAGDFAKETDVLVVNGYTVPTSLFLYWLAFNCSYFESNYYYYGLTVADYADSILADTCSMASYYALLEQKAIESGCPLTDEQVNTIKKDMEVGGETHEQRKELYGLTEEDLMFIYSMDAFYTNLLNAMVPTPSEEDLNNYVYQAKHILLATAKSASDGLITLGTNETVEYAGTVEEYNAAALAKAQDLYNQLVEAEKEGAHLVLFDQLMNEHSQDTRDSSGNLAAPNGYTTLTGKMTAEFETAALALEPDHFSEPVKSTYGYHIILRGEVEDLDSYAEAYSNGQMEGLLNTWLNETVIEKSDALESLDVAEFYERYIAWQTAYVEKNELVGE
jgi:hypothetical protein